MDDTTKVILVVVSPIIFFLAILILGLVYRRRVNRFSSSLLTAPQEDESQQEIPAQTDDLGRPKGLGPSINLPEYSEKIINVRRLSAYPEFDEIRRVSSVISSLADVNSSISAENGSRGSGWSMANGSEGSTLVVSDMGTGCVGVERRSSTDDMRKRSSVAGGVSDLGEPRDKRFSVHLPSHLQASETSFREPIQRLETLDSPVPFPYQQGETSEAFNTWQGFGSGSANLPRAGSKVKIGEGPKYGSLPGLYEGGKPGLDGIMSGDGGVERRVKLPENGVGVLPELTSPSRIPLPASPS